MSKFCMNCGKEIPDGSKFCPECGSSVEGGVKNNPSVTSTKKHGKTPYIIALLIVCFLGIFFVNSAQSEVLKGDDLAAYNILIEAAPNFKNPASIRLVSGSVSGGALFCAITGENSFGVSSTEYYWIYNGNVYNLEEIGETPSIAEKTTTMLNIPLINKHLAKYFS